MPINNLEYTQIFQKELDNQIVEEATTGWMEVDPKLVKYSGGNRVKIATIVMDGLADYDRSTGFVEGSISLTYEPYDLTQERGRTFMLDRMDVDETNFILTSGFVMGEFQRTKVIPEIDAYRYSKIATIAMDKGRCTKGYTPTTDTILETLLDDIATVQDEIGETIPLVITMARPVARILNSNKSIYKGLDTSSFKQGNLEFKVKSIDDIPIIRVPSSRLKTAYKFYTGRGEEKEGGFKPDASAKNINWLITAKNAPIAIAKTEKTRIFEPDQNQKADAWKLDYRKYHDLWILENKIQSIYVNIKEA